MAQTNSALPFVDAHVHLWDLDHIRYPWLTPPFREGPAGITAPIAVNYGLDDYFADAAAWNVRGMVHVDAGAHPGDALKETQWLQALADRRGMPQAIVAFADLNDPKVEGLLEAHAAHANVRGIRHIANWHSDPLRTFSARDVTTDSDWQRGFALLRKYNLSFDCQVYPSQFAAIAALAARHPDIPVILNHLGMPVISDPDGEVVWREGLGRLATMPHVFIKLSGIGFIQRRWSLNSIRPWLLTAIELFGPARCLVASDFPTDKLFHSFDAHLDAYHQILSEFSEAEQRAMFGRNAARVYHMEIEV